MTGAGFTVWVTGPEKALADAVAARLAARHVPVELLDERTPGIDALAGADLERVVAFVARTLARHGVSTVVALAASTRAGRDGARAELERMIEVHVHEGAGGVTPPERAEVEVLVPEPSPGSGVERTLRTLELLGFLPPGDRVYSEEEEREVIRRLKAFGYL
jgi:hypothetical protein